MGRKILIDAPEPNRPAVSATNRRSIQKRTNWCERPVSWNRREWAIGFAFPLEHGELTSVMHSSLRVTGVLPVDEFRET
jgi:hypothetical protein